MYAYFHDSFRWIECPPNKLKHYEKRLIKLLKPVLNSHHNTNNPKRDSINMRQFKKPQWMYYYSQFCSITRCLDKKLYPESEVPEMEHRAVVSEVEFEHYYDKHGFKGTILDDKYYK